MDSIRSKYVTTPFNIKKTELMHHKVVMISGQAVYNEELQARLQALMQKLHWYAAVTGINNKPTINSNKLQYRRLMPV